MCLLCYLEIVEVATQPNETFVKKRKPRGVHTITNGNDDIVSEAPKRKRSNVTIEEIKSLSGPVDIGLNTSNNVYDDIITQTGKSRNTDQNQVTKKSKIIDSNTCNIASNNIIDDGTSKTLRNYKSNNNENMSRKSDESNNCVIVEDPKNPAMVRNHFKNLIIYLLL